MHSYCVTSVDLLHISSTLSKHNISSNNSVRVLYSDGDNDGEDNRTPVKNKASPSKVGNMLKRNSKDDIGSRYEISGKHVSKSIDLRSDDEELLSPFEDVKPHRSIKR